MRSAAVTIRFAGGRLEPGSDALGADRLQVAAVFGDVDRRDEAFLADLAGPSSRFPTSAAGPTGLPIAPSAPVLAPVAVQPDAAPAKGARNNAAALDQCVRQPDPLRRMGGQPVRPPRAWMQLLDVGNVTLRAGDSRLPLRVQMVPSLFDATRGVRYDADQDMGRAWLAAGTLQLQATGGDGVAAFEARIAVPRPIRLTHVGGQPVRGGRVAGPPVDTQPPDPKPLDPKRADPKAADQKHAEPTDLVLRWGSVDGSAAVELQVGAQAAEGFGWLRCRLHDDGEFALPAALVATLPERTPDRPWLLVLVRSREAAIPGFDGTPLRLELTDSVHIL